MTTEQLHRYWRVLFFDAPHMDLIKVCAKFANLGPVYADILLGAMIESGAVFFPNEGARFLWIAKKISKQKDATTVRLRAA